MKIKSGSEGEYANYVAINSHDGYSKGVVDYGERWAAAMEDLIDKGASVAEIAKSTSSSADTEGITGFMYGCAVNALARFWEHGEDLRRWSNLDLQLGTEGEAANASGGVLYPALLTIATKETSNA